MKIVISFIFIILLIPHVDLHAVSYGSNTAVALESFVQFPQTDTNNLMLGFGTFANGFALASQNTTCTWNDFFSVGGPIFLNGGTLFLHEDLIFNASAQIGNAGTIYANNHAIILENEQTWTMPLASNTFCPVYVTSPINNYVCRSIGWSYDDNYLLTKITTGLFVFQFTGVTLIGPEINYLGCVGGGVSVWHPNQYYIALGNGQSSYELQVGIFNPSAKTFTITTSVNEQSTVNWVDWNASGTYLLESRVNQPTIKIYSFNATGSSLSLVTSKSGYPVGTSNNAAWNADNSYFAIASTGTVGLSIYSFDGVNINEVKSVTTALTPCCIDWSHTNSYIAVEFSSGSPNPNWLAIYQFTPPATLTMVSSYTALQSTSGPLAWSKDGTKLAAGYSPTNVAVFSFNPVSAALTLIYSYPLQFVLNCCAWSHSSGYLSTGENNNDKITIFSACNQNNVTFNINNAALQFLSNTYLNAPLIFQGISVLDGHNCALYLGGTGSISVASGSSLLLKNITIYNVAGTNISCVDNTATLSCYNVTWSQDSDVTFTQGQLAIIGELIMTGSHRFIYESDQVSTIYDLGNWYFDNGMTFSYAPFHGENNLIAFQDNQSILYLYGTTLYVSSTGLRFTNGCLTIAGQCQFTSDATTETNGIWIGDGNPSDDVKLKILPESGIITGSGYVSYRNVN